MFEGLRPAWEAFLQPIVKVLVAKKIRPDTLTIVGTLLVCLASVWFIPLGWFWQAGLAIAILTAFDSLDGALARASDTASKWGAFLDATLDRIADAAIFGSLIFLVSGRGSWWELVIAIAALPVAQVTSYVRARGQAEGFQVASGFAGRAERIVLVVLGLFGASFTDKLWPIMLSLAVIVVAGSITIAQRIAQVARQKA